MFSLSICYFMDCAFGIMCKNYSPCSSSRRFLPVLSSKSFTVLHLNLFPFSVNFWIGCEVYIGVCIFAYGYPVASVPFFEKILASSIELFLYLCQIIVGHICVGLILGPLFCSIVLCFYSFIISHNLNEWCISYVLKLSRVIAPTLFFFRTVLAILGLVSFHINFRIISSSYKKYLGDFD